MFDEAVLHPERISGAAFTEILAEAGRVRCAIELLESGSSDAALEQLREIPRSSPLADWKLFVRGLASYYDRDDGSAEENWSRLNAERPAARIARKLRQVGMAATVDPTNAILQGELAALE